MNNVLFLSGVLMSPEKREELRLPLHFISFAITDGQMYTTHGKVDSFVAKGLRPHGNSVVYGGLYVLEDYHFHIRTLDAMYLCSKSALGQNHSLDTRHRIIDKCTLISFNTLDELNRLQYKELDTIPVEMYVGNTNHPDLTKRILRRHPYNHRIVNGVHEKYFLQELRGGQT